jgi:flagellin-like protein
LKKLRTLLRNRRALSPIFATLLLAVIIIVFGSVAYYYSTNLTNTATNNYVSSLSGSQQAVAERIGFENVVYNSSSPAKLTVYIINSGSTNNLQINSTFLYDSNNNIIGVYTFSGGSISALKPIDAGAPALNSGLNVGKEAYFTITLGKDSSGNNLLLSSGSFYTINLITKNGSDFNYEFSP